jgi:hypothetical protein
MIEFNDAELTVMESDVVNIGVFFRLDTTPPVRIWLGFGEVDPGVNLLDASGAQYLGFGEIATLPPFRQLTNGAAERITLTLSGVSGDVLTIASGGDSEQVKGKNVSYGFAVMAANWSLLGPIHWCANYTADYLSITQEVTDDPHHPIIRTVSLSCGTLLTGRRRPGLAYFSDQDQQARFPGDRFCERTPVYANGFSKAWPIFH